jgi:hypothetical protein
MNKNNLKQPFAFWAMVNAAVCSMKLADRPQAQAIKIAMPSDRGLIKVV